MPVKTDKNDQDASGLPVSTETLLKTTASVIKPAFDTPEEVIGCLVREHLDTDKRLTLRELNLLLIARREMTPELHQKMLFNEALLLLTTSANS